MKVPLSLAAAGAIAILAACSGGNAGSPSSPSMVPLSNSPMSSIFDLGCKKTGKLALDPCSVDLSVSNPKATVTAKAPSGSTITFNDKDCTSKSIATITGDDGTYAVVAGTAKGKCTAKFTAKIGKTVEGTAVLDVSNKV